MKRILLTTTSFQDTPGEHHKLLEKEGFELVRQRGPLPEGRMLKLMGDIDGILCGDDAITQAVIQKALPRLRVISKYGIGLDKIDIEAATKFKIPVTFCPGVNHTTVAELVFGLLLALSRHIVTSCNHVKKGQWQRITGCELADKTLGIIGMGRVGKEVALRAKVFGMKILGYDIYWDAAFAKEHGIERIKELDEILKRSNMISLHTNLTDQTRGLINEEKIALMKDGIILINCARGELVDRDAIVAALKSGKILGYGADVLEVEPPPPNHPFFDCPNAILTPHIGSRTYESVARQARMAAENLILVLKGKKPLAQANSF